MQLADCYYLGKITKPHGFKGNLVFYLDTDEPQFYTNLESVLVKQNEQLIPFFLEHFSQQDGQKFIGRFVDMEGEEAKNMVNKELYLPLSSLPKLDGKRFYFHEIIGFTIFDLTTEQDAGEVVSVNDKGAQILLEILGSDKTQHFIPVVDDWLEEVNRVEKKMVFRLPEGLLQINASDSEKDQD